MNCQESVRTRNHEPWEMNPRHEAEPIPGLFSLLFARALRELIQIESEATIVQVDDFTPSDILETLGEVVESLAQGDALDTRKRLALEVAREAIRWMEGR